MIRDRLSPVSMIPAGVNDASYSCRATSSALASHPYSRRPVSDETATPARSASHARGASLQAASGCRAWGSRSYKICLDAASTPPPQRQTFLMNFKK